MTGFILITSLACLFAWFWSKKDKEKKAYKKALKKKNNDRYLAPDLATPRLKIQCGNFTNQKTYNGTIVTNHSIRKLEKFEFPTFPYTEETLVRIKDKTNYTKLFLGACDDKNERDNYDSEIFEHHLAPYMLDIELQRFDVMFKPETMEKLGFNILPSGFRDIYKNIIYDAEEDGEHIFIVADRTTENLLKNGFLVLHEPDKTYEGIKKYLFERTLSELRDECCKLGIKKNQNKKKIIEELLIKKDFIQLKPMAKASHHFFEFIENLGNCYIEDIKSQLENKPCDYAALIWEHVSEDTLLPQKAKNIATELYEELMYLNDK